MITKELVNGLGLKVVDHDDNGVPIGNGYRKQSNGTVIVPSGGRFEKVDGRVDLPDEQEYTPEAPAAVKGNKPRQKRASRESAPAPAPVQEPKFVYFTMENGQKIPSMCMHLCHGKGCAVIGVTDKSFIPAVSFPPDHVDCYRVNDSESRYMYTGWEFMDPAGIRNLILLELPESGAGAVSEKE